MMHQVATTPTHGELPGQAAPVGIAVEQVALSTRQAAAHLFPKERGLVLLTLLLLSGEVQKRQLASYGLVDVAVIRLQSIELFAQQHQGWSKDTALRSIAVLEALQILQRSRHAEYTELHVPLIPWSPSEKMLAALDELLVEDAAREKLQQLASGVKARFLLLYGTPRSEVRDYLHKRLSPTKRHLLQLRISTLKAQLEAREKKKDFRAGLPTEDDSEQIGEATPTRPGPRHGRRNEARVVTFHNKRAERVALPATLTVEEWKKTLEYFHHTCAYCGVNDYQVLEHVLPLTCGGGTTPSNCVPACVSCNGIKGDQDPSLLSPSSALAGTLPRVQKYLQTRKRVGRLAHEQHS